MSQLTERLHLTTYHADDLPEGGNHARAIFNIKGSGAGCKSDEKLSMALIKAAIPSTITAFTSGSGNGNQPDIQIYVSSTTVGVANVYFTENKLDMAGTENTPSFYDFYIPGNHLVTSLDVADTFNVIFAHICKIIDASHTAMSMEIDKPTGCFYMKNDATIQQGWTIDSKYFIPPQLPCNGRARADSHFSPGCRLFLQFIGINVGDNAYNNLSLANPFIQYSNNVSGTTPGNIKFLPIGTAYCPLKLQIGEHLNSVSSKPGTSDIISEIPIHFGYNNKTILIDTTSTTETDTTPLVLWADRATIAHPDALTQLHNGWDFKPTTTTIATESHLDLDGSDDHFEVSMGTDSSVMSWDKSWSIGINVKDIHNPGNAQKKTIFLRDACGIYFSCGASNWGFYTTATAGIYDPANLQGMTHSHGANTWWAPTSGVSYKFLFTYDHTQGKCRWYVDGVLKGTVTQTTTERTIGVATTDNLFVGDLMANSYYAGNYHWDGHIDDLLLTANYLVNGTQTITDYFADDNYSTHSYWVDAFAFYNLNQDPPTDTKGNTTASVVGGTMIQTAGGSVINTNTLSFTHTLYTGDGVKTVADISSVDMTLNNSEYTNSNIIITSVGGDPQNLSTLALSQRHQATTTLNFPNTFTNTNVITNIIFSVGNAGADFQGLPHDLTGVSLHPSHDHPRELLGFKTDTVYFYDVETKVQLYPSQPLLTVFPSFTGTLVNAVRYDPGGYMPDGERWFHNYMLQNDAGDRFKYGFDNATNTFNYQATYTGAHLASIGGQGNTNHLRWRFVGLGGVPTVDGLAGLNQTPYGPGTSYFPTLPNNVAVHGHYRDEKLGEEVVFIGQTMYKLNIVNYTVASSDTYNQPADTPGDFNFIDSKVSFTGGGLGSSLKLQPIGVNDIYWDLSGDWAAGRVLTSSTGPYPGYDIGNFQPNIGAGAYPMVGSFEATPTSADVFKIGNVTSGPTYNAGYVRYIRATANTWTAAIPNTPAGLPSYLYFTQGGDTTPGVNLVGGPLQKGSGACFLGSDGALTQSLATLADPSAPTGWDRSGLNPTTDYSFHAINLSKAEWAQNIPAKSGSVFKKDATGGNEGPDNFTVGQLEQSFYYHIPGETYYTFLLPSPHEGTLDNLYPKRGAYTIHSKNQIELFPAWQANNTLYTVDTTDPKKVNGSYVDPYFTAGMASSQPTYYTKATNFIHTGPAPTPTPTPGGGSGGLTESNESFIKYQNHDVQASHKIINTDNCSSLEMSLVDDWGNLVYSHQPIYYEVEVKWHTSLNANSEMSF